MAFDCAGITFTFAGAASVDHIAASEGVSLDNIADIVAAAIVHPEFSEDFLGSYVSLLKVTFGGLGEFLGFYVAETNLDGVVAVVLYGLLLDDHAGTGFNHSYRDDFARFVEDLSHTDLFADDSFFHLCFSSCQVIGQRFR